MKHGGPRHGAIAVSASFLMLTALLMSTDAFAVAGFARQTGMSCNQCHTSHGAATPNFTFTGKKFNAWGYRQPAVQIPVIKKGEPQDRGEHLTLNPVQWSGRFQWTGLSNVKPPAGPSEGEWGEKQTNPTSRFAVFPFIGPIGDHFGIWTEIYIAPANSAKGEWTIANSSYEEHDFRYVVNPGADNTYGFALTNQDPGSLFGFGPWPAVGLGSEVANRGGIGGYLHPNYGNLFAYGWMHDRWVWAIGENTGDTNTGWTKSNATGMFGWAIKNSNYNELWANVYFRKGNDALPMVTSDYVPTDKHDFFFQDSIAGISATRPAACPSPSAFVENGCPYLPQDLNDHTAIDTEVRWGRQDVGNWSFEIVGRLGFNKEDYTDGAKTKKNTWGVATQFGWRHTYYIKPYVNGRMDYDFTDRLGTKHKIDTSPSYGVWLAYKPVENFLLSFEYHNLQSWSLDGRARDDGARYAIVADISF
jgi:hypothetical protein